MSNGDSAVNSGQLTEEQALYHLHYEQAELHLEADSANNLNESSAKDAKRNGHGKILLKMIFTCQVIDSLT